MDARTRVWRSGLLVLALLGSSAVAAGPPGLQEATPDHATTTAGQPVLVDAIANDSDVGAWPTSTVTVPRRGGDFGACTRYWNWSAPVKPASGV